jgi:hypothetical protein
MILPPKPAAPCDPLTESDDMGDDDDNIALSLPQPPPPMPARREAAIDEALRRFDAAGEPPPVATGRRLSGRKPEPWGTRISRTQAGVLVSAALVALIGVPAVWMSVSHQSATVGQKTLASAADGPAMLDSVAPEPLAQPSPPPAVLADEEAKASAASPPAPAMELAQNDAAPPPVSQMRAEKGFLARSEREVQLAEAAMPPPPPAAPAGVAAPPAEMGAAADMAESVVVTARRRATPKPVGRGDWNACTVNDPGHSLSGCKTLFDPGAAGPAGRAAAHLADGLSRAWQGDFDGAIAAFDQAIDIAPRLSFAYLNRGLAYQHRGELDRAIADLDRAVRYAPGVARGYYNRSLLLRQRGDADRASTDEDRAVRIDPRYDAVVR